MATIGNKKTILTLLFACLTGPLARASDMYQHYPELPNNTGTWVSGYSGAGGRNQVDIEGGYLTRGWDNCVVSVVVNSVSLAYQKEMWIRDESANQTERVDFMTGMDWYNHTASAKWLGSSSGRDRFVVTYRRLTCSSLTSYPTFAIYIKMTGVQVQVEHIKFGR